MYRYQRKYKKVMTFNNESTFLSTDSRKEIEKKKNEPEFPREYICHLCEHGIEEFRDRIRTKAKGP